MSAQLADVFDQAIDCLNAEAYRDALLAFEECWFADRSEFLRGLIQLCNALHQLQLGLVSGPRRTLASAARLLAPYAPAHAGLDVAALCSYIASVRATIPDDLQTGQGNVEWAGVPRIQLQRRSG